MKICPRFLTLLLACQLCMTAQVLPPTEVQTAISTPYESAEGRVVSTTTQLDILVAYTPAARAYAGGTNAMKAAIHSHIALANRCYSNSDIPILLRAVAIVETNYTEGATFNVDLTKLQSTSDGVMDELHALRTTYGADLVALIRRNDAAGVAGLAYVNTGNGDAGFAPWAFSVTADNWASGNIAFPHEVGHNLGCYHDRGNSAGATHAYAYGWRFYGDDHVQYITVMAYYPGTRIPYFSNPTIRYQGQPTGVASGGSAADNALRHEITAAGTAAYRADGIAIGSGVRGDLNGDGYADLLFKGDDGRICAWFMNGAARSSLAVFGNTFTPSIWTPVAAADFNGDGKSDLLFKSNDGRLCVWFMNGTVRTSALVSASAFTPSLWTPVAAADFDRDGKADILFASTTGQLCVWFMSGATRTSVSVLPATYTPSLWTPIAAADFDGDGRSDLLFKSTAGQLCIWFMSGTTRSTASILVSTFTAALWTPIGSADFNGDSKSDILFKSTAGQLCIWFMNGTTRSSATVGANTFGSAWNPF